MAHEPKTRKSARLKKQQPPVSFMPSKRAHLAQKSLFDSDGKPTGIEVVLPPLPPPFPEDILYCGPEPDFEAVYFAMYDTLAHDCYKAEKTGQINSAALKEKAKLILHAIGNTTQLTNNNNIRNLFNHLAQLISDHLILPEKLKLKHLQHFLSRKTNSDQEMLEDYSSPVPEEELLPFISAKDNPDNIDPYSVDPILEGLDEWEDFFDVPIEDYRVEAVPPRIVVVNSSWAKIMAMMPKIETTTLKRPESPSSEETLTVTPPPSKKPTLEQDLVTQVSCGLRIKERKNYYLK